MAAMKENTRKVFEYLKAHNGEDLTAADVAEALSLEKRQVDGIFTSALQRKQLGERIPAEREEEDGSHTKIKLLKLTEAGMNFDPDAEE
jgi:hypothetical protein